MNKFPVRNDVLSASAAHETDILEESIDTVLIGTQLR